jgi:hypothetical protein
MTGGIRTLQVLAPYRKPGVPEAVEVIEIRPEGVLGSLRESMIWTEPKVRSWIAQGREDAQAFLATLKHEPS